MTISREGATAFFWLSSFAKDYGLIARDEFEARLDWLRKMMAVEDDIQELAPQELAKGSSEEKGLQGDTGSPLKGTAESCLPRKRRGSSWLPLAARGALTGWLFHQYDCDPRPSVPHGHYESQSYPKLDPYTGWIWIDRSNSTKRVAKQDTAELWNDPKFRKFAYRAIGWYMNEFPNFNWRVKHPLRLPKSRK